MFIYLESSDEAGMVSSHVDIIVVLNRIKRFLAIVQQMFFQYFYLTNNDTKIFSVKVLLEYHYR